MASVITIAGGIILAVMILNFMQALPEIIIGAGKLIKWAWLLTLAR